MSESVDSCRVFGRTLGFWVRVTLVWLMAVTVSGAAVRLTGSGLGCTDWPTCEANSLVVEASFHPLIEFGNRVVSGLAILPVMAVFVLARRDRSDLLRWVWLLVGGFIGQVVLGMIVTRTELDPRVVLGHFLLSIVLVWLAVVLDHRARRRRPGRPRPPHRLRTVARGMLAVSALTIVVGTLVTGSGPHTGSDEADPIPRLGFDITDITRVHSIVAWLLVGLVLVGLVQTRHSPGPERSRLTAIAVVGFIQGGIGYVQFATGVPVLLVAIHVSGAVLLWTAVSFFAIEAEDGFAVASASAPSPAPVGVR